MLWKCSVENHPSWNAKYHDVINKKYWCNQCRYNAIREEGFQKIQKYAQDKGGQCLSTEYMNDKTLILWKCHVPEHMPWKAKFNSLKQQKTWCRECFLQNRIKEFNGLEKANEFAKKKNGLCLSKQYVHNEIKLLWKCHVSEHKPWKARLGNLLHQDQWCPECANTKNKTENRVRLFLETHFKFKLPSAYPVWNINPKTGKLLELDGYNKEYKIAFEHDGQHHFQHTKYSASIPREEFIIQQERDKAKNNNCLKQGVKLITIPILEKNCRYKFFPLLRYVISKCKEQDIEIAYTLTQIKQMKRDFNFFDNQKNSHKVRVQAKIEGDKENFLKNINNFNSIEEILKTYEYPIDNANKSKLKKFLQQELEENHLLLKKLPYKVNYPDLATLESMIKEQGYSAVGRILGCSDNAVRGYIKRKKDLTS